VQLLILSARLRSDLNIFMSDRGRQFAIALCSDAAVNYFNSASLGRGARGFLEIIPKSNDHSAAANVEEGQDK